MNDRESFKRASAAALRFLSYRPRSEAEVRTRLGRRFPSDVVERVMKALIEQELVDDPSFAKLWSDNRDSLHPRSAAAIKRELISKGVGREVAEIAVRDLDDQDSAYRAALKPARQLELADYSTFHRRLLGYLHRRGFGPSVTRDTIARIWDERKVTTSHPRGAR